MKRLFERLEAWARRPKTAQMPPPGARDPWVPDWDEVLKGDPAWEAARQDGRGGPRVLIATSLPGVQQATILETTLAAALTLRGAEAHFLLCDEALSACLNLKWWTVSDPARVVDGSWKQAEGTCAKCRRARHSFNGLGLPLHEYGHYLSAAERAWIATTAAGVAYGDIAAYRHEGAAIGEHALAGALRYFSRGSLEGQPGAEGVLREYFKAALETAVAVGNLLKRHRFDVAVFHHGIYVPQGIVGEVCRAAGVRVVTWNPAYRKQCFIFSHGDTYHHTLLEEPVTEWSGMEFTDAHDAEIKDYLQSRWSGAKDWIWFHGTPDDKDETLVKETGLDLSKPVIGLLTNVVWDAQLHYRANAFPSMLDWLEQTIRYFAGRPDLQLLIRVHPAEIRGTQPSRQPVTEEIRKAFPVLPRNVFVIGPESDINTYSAMAKCDSVIIFGTKTGVELASMGIPVIVAGEAWIRNKGLTLDVTSAAQYREVLDRLPLRRRMAPEDARRARQYAYHFFLRRMIPIAAMAPSGGKVPYKLAIGSLRDLAAGADPGLDVVCDGILQGGTFVYRAEEPRKVSA